MHDVCPLVTLYVSCMLPELKSYHPLIEEYLMLTRESYHGTNPTTYLNCSQCLSTFIVARVLYVLHVCNGNIIATEVV